MNNYLVYCHKVPNDKIYIGITNNPISRFRKGKGYYDNESFYSDICKFG